MQGAPVAVKRFDPGEIIFKEGERSFEMYIILSGKVRILKDRGEKKILLAELADGAIIGEMALISGEPRSASAIAVNEVTVKVVSQQSFE